jgi:hypothetical protein
MNRTIFIAGLAGVLVIGSVVASPYITLYQMKNAMQNGDADAFSTHVDFPTLRENFMGKIMAEMGKKMASPEEMAGNPMAGFGQAMAVAFIGPMVDTMISPAGVIAMMKSNMVAPVIPNARKVPAVDQPLSKAPSYSVDYQGWGRVLVRNKESSGEVGGFIFRRNGIWDWRLSAIDLPTEFMKRMK